MWEANLPSLRHPSSVPVGGVAAGYASFGGVAAGRYAIGGLTLAPHAAGGDGRSRR